MGNTLGSASRVYKTARISGIFSRAPVVSTGLGGDRGVHAGTTYWLVRDKDDSTVAATPLSPEFVPREEGCILVARDVLFEEFSLEAKLSYEKISLPLSLGDNYRGMEEYERAEGKYLEVKNIDFENIRANFGLGIVYLELGKREKGEKIFQELMSLEDTFSTEYKHLFNEFGVALRKMALYDSALRYYFKALQLSERDDHLHFNVSRVYFEMGDLDGCKRHLELSLGLNPDNEHSRLFIDFVSARGNGN
jgi:tetratricopeptide (TPR) repeat protein